MRYYLNVGHIRSIIYIFALEDLDHPVYASVISRKPSGEKGEVLGVNGKVIRWRTIFFPPVRVYLFAYQSGP